MCHRGGRQYGSYCPATPQNEGYRVEHSTTVLLHQEDHWNIALLVRKNPFMRHILSFYSVCGCNTTSRIFIKGKQVLLFEDSNVPEAV